MKNSRFLFTALIALVLTVNCSYAQTATDRSRMVARDNENCYSYPVLLNGQILDYADFTMKSRGQLFMATGNAGSADATTVPFYICLRRDGKMVKEANMLFLDQPMPSIELSDVLSFSKPGDQLIITPVTNPGCKAKLKLKIGC